MKFPSNKFAWRRTAGMLIPIAMGLLAAALLPHLDAWERVTWDLRFVHRGALPPSGRVVLVSIDDKTTGEEGKWANEPMMMWGPHFADAVLNLKKAGAAAVGFDMVQLASTEELAERLHVDPFDRRFAEALGEAQNVILATMRGRGKEWVQPAPQLLYGNGGIDNLGAATFAQGANVDPDGVVRAFRPVWPIQENTARVSALGLRLAEKALGVQASYQGKQTLSLAGQGIPLHPNGTLLINYCGPTGTFPSCSLVDAAEGRLPPGMDLRGKIVLIGETYIGTQDLHLTPFSRGARADQQHMPGVEIWANVVDALLQHRYLRATEVPAGRLLLVALALVTGVIFLSARQITGLVAAAGLMGAWYGACEWMFRAHDYMLLMFAPMCLIPANYFSIIAYRFFTEEREKRKIQGMWGRYCNPKIVEYLLQHPEAQAAGGKRTMVTVLFSDIRGFTAMSDEMPATAVVRMLNEYFRTMTGIVVKYEGIVDKYVGDAIMAVWGAPVGCDDGPERAARTAVEMVRALGELNARWQNQVANDAGTLGELAPVGPDGRPLHLQIGIGINTGEAVSGNIGSEHKLDFTVIGDTVNLASRFESLTKELHVPIVIGDATCSALGKGFLTRALPPTAVKGKAGLVPVFTIEGTVGEDGPDPLVPAAESAAAG